MANMITLNTPTAPEYLQGFIDRWTQGRQNAQQNEIQRGNLDVNRRNASVNEGQLQFQQGEAKDKGLKDESMGILKQVVQLKLANREADAKALVDQVKAQRPELVPHMGEIAAALVHTPADDEARNTQQVFANDSQSVLNSTQPPPLQTTPMSVGENGNLVGGVNPTQPEMAPPNPQAADRFSKRNFGNQGLSPQAMEDVQAQQPGAGGYNKALRRNVGDLTTAAQDQQAATQKDVARINAASDLAKAKLTIAGGAASEKKNEGETIANEIIAGRQPPVVNSRTLEGPVRAALGRAGYDLTTATQDWTATQKYLQTLNGAGQVRLRQAVDFAYESIGVVRDLSEQWKAGGYPLLNSGRLFAAKQGVLGPQAQALAVKLDSQITEMQSELAVVYRGGNAPTDEVMKQASKILQTNWSEKTLLSNIDLLETNLKIRRNSIVTAGAAAPAGNIYAPNVTLNQPAGGGAGAAPSPADRQFIDSAMKITNPATGKPYTHAEAEAELQRRKGGA